MQAGREIEFPPGSGHRAFYEPHELELMQALCRQHDRGEISDDAFKNQFWWIHGLKSMLDARMLAAEDAGGYDAPPPAVEAEQSSLFEAPRVVRDPFASR